MITLDEIKVIVKLTASENSENAMKAIVALDFGGIFKIKGFRVQESKYTNEAGEKVWVTPPSYFAKGGYHPTFFSEDKEWWKKLEAKILEAFRAAEIEDSLKDASIE